MFNAFSSENSIDFDNLREIENFEIFNLQMFAFIIPKNL